MAYAYNTETLYANTNDGLLIIEHYLSDCKGFKDALQNPKKRHFHLRGTENDKSASAMLIQPRQVIDKINGAAPNNWRIHDFGGKTLSPIQLAMQESGLEFPDCLKMLYELFSLAGAKGEYFAPEKEFKTCDKDDKREIGWFNIVTKPEVAKLDIIGKYVTPKIAKNYNFSLVDFYESVYFNEKTKEKCYLKITATDQFPIFCYSPDGKWYKLYSPYAVADDKGRKYKHGYLGKKPVRYVHGLQQVLESINTDLIDSYNEQLKNKPSESKRTEITELRDKEMLSNLIICSGGSDGMNVASLGYPVIWFNSESEQISHSEYSKLKPYVKNIYNLPDIDKSGIEYGYAVAENFWSMKSIWLPKESLVSNGKDFRDWMKFHQNADLESIKFQFQGLLIGATKMKFFDRNEKTKTLKINTANLHYFLKVKGFHLYYPEKKYAEKVSEQEYLFIRIEKNIVYQEFANTIKKFCENYMIKKGQSLEVINLIKNTTQFTDKNLLGLDSIVLNIQNFTADSQNFYFKNQFVTITADKVELKPYTKLETHIWNNKLINYTLVPEKPFFSYKANEKGKMELEILRNDCEYMNFLINTSRMNWKKENIAFENNPEGLIKYHEENRFRLTSEYLSDEDNEVHTKHMLSKMFGIGYMAHRYKIDSFARLLYIMDDTERDNEDERNGGSGKTLILKGLDPLMKRFKIDGSKVNLFNDPFILASLSKEHDYILIDDFSSIYNLYPLYVWITDGANIRQLHKASFEMEFEDFPKMALTRNFGLKQTDGSDRRRILFISNSDFYHSVTSEFTKEHKVSHDFGHDLFKWGKDSKQPSIHFGFIFQCLQLYLQYRDKELLAPQYNIDLNNSLTGIGDTFKNWADNYFVEDFEDEENSEIKSINLNKYIRRDDMMQSYLKSAGKNPKGATNFKKSLKEYCDLILHDKDGNVIKNKWKFNPEDVQGFNKKTKNIYKRVGENSDEHFYIRFIQNDIPPQSKTEQKKEAPSNDLPF